MGILSSLSRCFAHVVVIRFGTAVFNCMCTLLAAPSRLILLVIGSDYSVNEICLLISCLHLKPKVFASANLQRTKGALAKKDNIVCSSIAFKSTNNVKHHHLSNCLNRQISYRIPLEATTG